MHVGVRPRPPHPACIPDSGWKVLVFGSGEKIALPGLAGVLLRRLPAPGSLAMVSSPAMPVHCIPSILSSLTSGWALPFPAVLLCLCIPVLIGVFPRVSQTHLLGGPVLCQVLSSHPGREEPLGPTSGLQELIGQRSLEGSIRLLFGHTFPPCFL